ncbi:MAG: PfaD family polyunsaturated fatty acid/polyketide biosynthesis protein [Polyangia bacterium]
MSTSSPSAVPPFAELAFDAASISALVARVREPLHLFMDEEAARVGVALEAVHARYTPIGTLPPLYPEWLGDRAFTETHGLRFPYVAGEMANGIASVALVVAMARAGMLGFFGAAGLSLSRVEQAIDELEAALADEPWGINLIHSPHEPALEEALVDLYVRRGVRRVSASAFMALSLAVVRLAATGLARDVDGRVIRRHHVFAKISRSEVATAFMSPPPAAMLETLVTDGRITHDEAALAATLPVATEITVEADSGGHTDNRPLVALFPAIRALADTLSAQHRYDEPIRVGVGGGLGTPASVAAAFSLGAAYVVTGSVNQAAIEAGLSTGAKELLCGASMADVVMAPAADMFEQGVKVQVLRRGTLFGMRAQRLYELYRAYDGLDAIPPDVIDALEREILLGTVASVWTEVQRYFAHDPAELERAAREPKHRMALVFRWYLGLSSRWAIEGDPRRRADYQIWCGPAMGAFNEWVRGSFLEPPAARAAVQIALNFLEGAATIARAQQLRAAGVAVPAAAFSFAPRPLA